jgi:hypothetical protein
MIESAIVFGWVFVLVAAWGLAGQRRATTAEAEGQRLRREVGRANVAAEQARRTVAEVLRGWEQAHRDAFRTLDDTLKTLPREWGKGPPYFRMMATELFDTVAHLLCSEPMDRTTFTSIDFDAVRFRVNGRDYPGWRRGGWILVPDAIS